MIKTTCKLVFRGINNLGPPIYDKRFNLAVPNRDLRSSEMPNAVVPTCRKNLVNIMSLIGDLFIGTNYLVFYAGVNP